MQIVKYPKEKIILTDVDGCLLDWNTEFHCWMENKGYNKMTNATMIEDQYNIAVSDVRKFITEFNNSESIQHLPVFLDADYYVEKLKMLGYKFICITSIGTNENIKQNRIKNLQNLFGEKTFLDFVFLATYADKKEILEKYKNIGKYWVEDNYKQFCIGKELGLESFYLNNESNTNTWKQIYGEITKND